MEYSKFQLNTMSYYLHSNAYHTGSISVNIEFIMSLFKKSTIPQGYYLE